MIKSVRVKAVEVLDGADDVYDVWNKAPDVTDGNFIANGIVVHNCIPDYVERRDDPKEKWRQLDDERITAVLNETYNTIVYQEQLQALWQTLAGFTSPEAQEARKAVAKKWRDKLKPIKEKWIVGAARTLGRAKAEEWWTKMETFGRYAFNRCLDKDTVLVDCVTNRALSVEEWAASGSLPTMPSLLPGGIVGSDRCVAIHDTGLQEVFEVEFDNGQVERVTLQHKFLCSDGRYHTVAEIYECGLDVTDAGAGRPDDQAVGQAARQDVLR